MRDLKSLNENECWRKIHLTHMGPRDLIIRSCLLYHFVQNWKYIIIIIIIEYMCFTNFFIPLNFHVLILKEVDK